MKRILAVTLVLVTAPALAGTGSVSGSKHDFSASGPGARRAVGERSSCAFCHTSHGAGPGTLSNRPDSPSVNRSYTSATMKGRTEAPGGASRICLSCHDGTVAVGKTRKGAIPMAGDGGPLTPGAPGFIGTDLRNSHPISVRVSPNSKIHAPARGDRVRLDAGDQVQCTSCHDPHDEWGDPVAGKFLVKPLANSDLCTACHEAGLGAGSPSLSHLSAARPRGAAWYAKAGKEPGTGCAACHVSHGADPERGQLLRSDRRGDDLCLGCHADGSASPIAAQYRQPFSHGVPTGGRHDPAEGKHEASRLPETSPGAPRHVSCADCHNPHVSSQTPAGAPAASGALAGVWGIDLQGDQVTPARYEYEICFKCHADSANKPQDSAALTIGTARRANEDFNLRRVFAPGAVSSHPVASSPHVGSPSLSPQAAAQLYCSDCHSSDLAQGSTGSPLAQKGGSAPRGPHGSAYPHILERQYRTSDLTPESPEAYALCYKCHVRDVLLSDASSFPLHQRHVVKQSTPCSACHDAHGISAESGTARGNAHLVSFDLEIVKAGDSLPPAYESRGTGHGSCTLTCHGVVHGPTTKAFSY